MLTSKQRAKLKGIASGYDTIFQVGKFGVSDETVTQLNLALNTRELIKIKVLETSPLDVREVAEEIAVKTKSEIVQVIGSKIIVFKQNKDPKKRVISLA